MWVIIVVNPTRFPFMPVTRCFRMCGFVVGRNEARLLCGAINIEFAFNERVRALIPTCIAILVRIDEHNSKKVHCNYGIEAVNRLTLATRMALVLFFKRFDNQSIIATFMAECPCHYWRIRINKPVCCMRIKFVGRKEVQDVLFTIDLT